DLAVDQLAFIVNGHHVGWLGLRAIGLLDNFVLQTRGVVTTASGLQYEVVKKADGPQPKPTDVVTVHYEGKLIDGKVFDSSVERGSPIDLPVSGVIPGWVEALQLMHVGEKYKLFIPADLAYGAQSPSPLIPANSVLVFDLELIAIKDPAQLQGGEPEAEAPADAPAEAPAK
ncbi:FKBP-type peptidyl-prolyl cis-trans isomerase, partial [uncultured Pseudomonas sp.]|uniref:FKBP-type peptidyl-prolyl cis-trans isomerase n=1 Tax=uncultured Pseudomonas sp. TaxID=114707 RepID=UPI0025893DCC